MLKMTNWSQAVVAHVCKPSYSGGRDQEARGSKPTRPHSSRDPISKETIAKKGWWDGLTH
jgi:hypothetical protein